MSIWEDISLHIHKIVSCVLTIPFVELRPGRRRPSAAITGVHSAARLQTHPCERLSLSFI